MSENGSHMGALHELFAPRGRVTEIANEMHLSPKTVWQWKKDGAVPEWRRQPLLAALGRLKIAVPPELLSYLALGA